MKAALPALRIERARLANARPGDRERLAAALGLASPAATGIGEGALLLIRRMRLERPLQPSGIERFAGELIDRIRAAKVGARRGPAAAGDSVYFEDEVALEVAIVRAWLAGDRLPAVVLETVAGSAAPVARWRRSLLPDAPRLPRLVAALVEAGLAAPWFARFSDGELAVAAATLLRTHGAQMLTSPSPAAPPDAEEGRPARHPDPPVTVPATIAEAIAIAATVSPRERVRVFVALCLVASRRPALLTTQVLRTALANMARAPEAASAPIARHPIALPPPLPAAVDTAAHPPLTPVRAGAVGEQPIESVRPKRVPAHLGAASFPRTAQDDRPSTARPIPWAPAAPALAEARLPAPVISDHAGLFFLLNSFLALGLYGDFTDPVQRCHGLSPFELLLLLGRHWLGRRLRDDPIEPVLRGLAGLGPRERIGRHFEAPVWQVPHAWLAPWPRTRARSVASRGGVSRWHRQGFVIADRSRVPRSATWRRRRWVACLARYIEARTMLALGATDATAAIASVLQLPGAITVDPERVDVEFALNELPLRVRLAGLDRDPGWIPAAGRSIRFHFT